MVLLTLVLIVCTAVCYEWCFCVCVMRVVSAVCVWRVACCELRILYGAVYDALHGVPSILCCVSLVVHGGVWCAACVVLCVVCRVWCTCGVYVLCWLCCVRCVCCVLYGLCVNVLCVRAHDHDRGVCAD